MKTATKRTKTRTVTLADGRTIPLAVPAVVGEKPCPGEAHGNPHIDNCGVCMSHHWGFVRAYGDLDVVGSCAAGMAVELRWVPEGVDVYELADAAGLRLAPATEKLRGGSSCSFHVLVSR